MYKITNEISGTNFLVTEKQSVLSAALERGVALPYGCQKGVCGKCKALIISGKVRKSAKKEADKGITADDIASGFALMCQCKPMSDLVIAVDELQPSTQSPDKVKKFQSKVFNISYPSKDVAELKIKILGDDLMQFFPGQYIDLLHPKFEPRSFSIANMPNYNNIIELHIRMVAGGRFTSFVFTGLKEQSLLDLEGPKGSFYLRDNKKPVIMLAGGTGFAPVKSMVEHSIAKELRDISIYWGVRDKADLYSRLPYEWAKRYPQIKFIPVLSQAKSPYSGRFGYVHNAVLEDYNDISGYDVYACGPPVMVESASKTFVSIGLDKKNFYYDAFEYQ